MEVDKNESDGMFVARVVLYSAASGVLLLSIVMWAIFF